MFEKFIDVCLEYYGLDPCHCFSSPKLAWDAMLKMTGVKLELISDIDMHLFIEKGMSGGGGGGLGVEGCTSYMAKRYCRENNKFVKGYDKNSDDSFIMYFDASNLYGWAMTECLPYGGFTWMSEDEISDFDFNLVEPDSDEYYILEVDLEYPEDLHVFHNDYPLAPEKLKIEGDMLSRYCSDIAKKYGIKAGEINKLIPNLRNKINYVVHYKNLQLYVSLGIKVVKIHRILKFRQSDWLGKFVHFNTEERMRAANKFEESYFKLMVTSVYGKTMENLRKRLNVKLVNNPKDYIKCVSRPAFVCQKIFSKNLVAIHKIKPVLRLNKPIYVGFYVLELRKWFMYDWHYKYFKVNCDVKLLFTDTDSLVYEIKGVSDIYEKIYSDSNLFDFSNYSKESKFYDCGNKKVIGKMKDEFGGVLVSEFVRLKSKMSSLITVDDEEKTRAKGENKKLKYREFFDVLFDKKVLRHTMKRIQAKCHRLGTYNICEVFLSCFDDKGMCYIMVLTVFPIFIKILYIVCDYFISVVIICDYFINVVIICDYLICVAIICGYVISVVIIFYNSLE